MEGNECTAEEAVEEKAVVAETTDDAESPSNAEPAEVESGEDPNSVSPTTTTNIEVEDETTIVARALQQLITLPRLKSAFLSQQALEVMRHFVEERTEEILTIFLDGEQLMAFTGNPRCSSTCCVITRLRSEPLTVDKLNQQVTHLSIPRHVTEAALVILESGFAQPFVYNNSTWPLSSKTRLCGLLHELFSEIGRQQHSARGLTMLYVPKEGLEEQQDNTIMLGRFEEAIARWYEQVSAAVSAEQLDSKLPLVTDIIIFWNKKFENMCYLEQQLNGKAIQKILPMLDVAQSDAGRQLRTIISQATRGKVEAQSNTKYLSTLNEPCTELFQCTDVTDIKQHVINILNVVRLIWLKAPHFNSRGRVMQLFLCLSHQIIDVCTRTINLRSLFRGRPMYGMKRANDCIECCQDYIQVYEEISELHRKYTEHSWDLDTKEIFSSIYTFINRCKDVKEICEAMMIFGRINEKTPVINPIFCGPNSQEFEKICDEVKSQINKEIEVMTKIRSIILDVTCASWQNEMNRFRCQVASVERRIEALTHSVMEETDTVDEALRAMHSLHHFLQKPSFKSLWEEKSNYVYGLFLARIDSVSQAMLGGENVGYMDLPPYSGAALMAHHNKKHLQRQMKLITETRVLTTCGQKEHVTKEYKFLISVIDDTIQEYRDMWTASLTGDWEARLRRPLLIPSPSRIGMIEPTLSRDVVECMHEARMWQGLGFEPPSHMQELCNREKSIIELRECMLTICRTYNETIARTSDAEKSLFKDLILNVDKDLNPAFSHYSWRSKVPTEFIVKSNKVVDELLKVTRQFHEDCRNIVQACTKIADAPLLYVKPECIYQVQDVKTNLINAIKPLYEEVFQILAKIKRRIGKFTTNVVQHWSNFVITIANIVDESVILFVKDALQKFLIVLTEKTEVFIHVTASIKDNVITFEPPIKEVTKTIYNTLDCIIYISKSIPKFDKLMKLTAAKRLNPLHIKLIQNGKCRELQNLLGQEADYCLERIREYAESWEEFSWLWTMKCKDYITQYEHKNPFAASISQDIDRIAVLVEESNLKTTLQVSFIEVDASAVKDIIQRHVKTWQAALLRLLLDSTLSKAQKFNLDLNNDMTKLSKDTDTVQDLANKTMDCQFAMAHIPSKDIQLQILFEHQHLLAHYKVPVPEYLKDEMEIASKRWHEYLACVDTAKNTLQVTKQSFRAKLIDSGNALNRELAKLCSDVHKNGPFQTSWEESAALDFLESTKSNLQAIKDKKEDLSRDFDMFGLEPPQLAELQNIENVRNLRKILDILSSVWEARKSWVVCWSNYKQCKFSNLETDKLNDQVSSLSKRLGDLTREPAREWSVLEETREAVENVKHALPLVTLLRTPSLRTRHWDRIQAALKKNFDPRSENFTLKEALDMGVTNFEDEIKTVVEDADVEYKIEKKLNSICLAWECVKLDTERSFGSKIIRVKSTTNICNLIDQHLGHLAVIGASRFIGPFFKDVKIWKNKLYRLIETVNTLSSIQKNMFHFEIIPMGQNSYPKSSDIKDVYKSWNCLVELYKNGKNIMQTGGSDDYVEKLTDLNIQVELLWSNVQLFLDEKCHVCPRLYLLSSREKLRLLQIAHDNHLAHKLICICFPGTSGLKFGRQINEVLGLCAENGEILNFTEPVILQGSIEEKINMLEIAMKNSLHSQLVRSCDGLQKSPTKRERWMKVFITQVCIIASKVLWTTECTKALHECVKSERRKPLRLMRQEQEIQVSKLCEVMRGEVNNCERLKIASILISEIHALNVIDKLYESEGKDPCSYNWQTQLRFYRDPEHHTFECRQMFGAFNYDYEYYGDDFQPIITPQTDRCFIFLTTMLQFKMAGLIRGPQGSGKSELLRGLAINLGRLLLSFNCTQGINNKLFVTILSGVARLGAWCVLEEFLSVPESTLSVLSQQLRQFITAIHNSKDHVSILDSEIALHRNTVIFITLTTDVNGDSKRSLPACLRALFRPVSTNSTNTCNVIEKVLLSEGISDANAFAHKVCRLYELCKLHLSSQSHYEFGSRKLVHIARNAGAFKRAHPDIPDEEVILQTVATEIEPMLTPEDYAIYLEYTSDLFPGVEAKAVEIKRLSIAVNNALQREGLMPLPSCVKKSLQIYEALRLHRSVALVGKNGSGKSTACLALSIALESTRGFNPVQIHRIYPNSLTYSEMYGEYNDVTGEFMLGVFTKLIKKLCSEKPGKTQWILFDGKMSKSWTDGMLEILDGNGTLTLGNGERLNMPDKIKFLFEVEDFTMDPPSVAPYCSFINFNPDHLEYWTFIHSWLQTISDGLQKEEISRLFTANLDECIKFKKTECKEITQQSSFSCVQTFCRLLKSFLECSDNELALKKGEESAVKSINHWFYFCMVWSIFGAVEREYHSKVEAFVRDLEGTAFPSDGTIFDFCYDPLWDGYLKWFEKFPNQFTYNPRLPFYKTIVPSLDLVRYTYVISTLVNSGHSVILAGNIGTGKSIVVENILKNLNKEKFLTLIINSTAQRSKSSVLNMINRKLEKRSKNVLVPVRGKKLVIVLEDMSLLPRDEDYCHPVLEMFRHWIEYGIWCDLDKKYINIKNIQILGTLQHRGRNCKIDQRFQRHFSIFNLSEPSDDELRSIFGSIFTQHLLTFGEQIKQLGKNLINSSISVYRAVKNKLLPTPMYSHYVFNIKDVAMVFQGLLLSNRECHNTRSSMCRLWLHENLRVYYDRLIDDKDRTWFMKEISSTLFVQFRFTMQTLCPDNKMPLFGHFSSKPDESNVYVEMSTEETQAYLEQLMTSRGEQFVVFKDIAEHVTRLVRTLSQPASHLMLIGKAGSGRRSLTKIACQICSISLYYAHIGSNCDNQVNQFKNQIKMLVYQAAVQDKLTALLLNDTQVVQDEFLDVIHNIIANGQVHELFEENEIEEMISDINQRNEIKSNYFDPEEASEIITDRIRHNLRILLCFDHTNPKFRERLYHFPALAKCSMNFFSIWPRDALLQVAQVELKKINLGEDQDDVKQRLANVFVQLHESTIATIEKLGLHIAITTVHYFDCLKSYTLLLNKKQQELRAVTAQLKQALQKIEETKKKVGFMSEELLQSQRQVLERQRRCEAALVTLGQRKREVEEQGGILAVRANQIAQEEAATQQLDRLARTAMDEALPCLEEADMALDSLNHKELQEMRAYGRPPENVELVMSAVLIFKQSEPTWVEAKRQLADTNFIEQLHNFDKDHIPDKTLKSISSFTSNPDFNPDKIGIISVPAKYLALWVIAIEKYGKIYRSSAPKRAKIERASRELREHQAELADLQTRLSHLRVELKQQKDEYEHRLQERDSLNTQAEAQATKLQRANDLLSGLGSEEERWRSSVQFSSKHEQLLLGDCLLAAAMLSYAGPFSSDNRNLIQQNLHTFMKESKIDYSDDMSVSNLLANKMTLREWQLLGLPEDSYTADNAVTTLYYVEQPLRRWPILIDPQNVAKDWLQNMSHFKNLKVIDQNKKGFIETVEGSIKSGYPLMIERVENNLIPALDPILLKQITTDENGDTTIFFNGKKISYHSGFQLIFTTSFYHKAYGSDISARVNIIDFTIQTTGMEEKLLNIIIRNERAILEVEKKKLCSNILSGLRTVQKFQEDILKILIDTSGSLLDNEAVMDSLEQNKSATITASNRLTTYEESELEVIAQRQSYLSCATRAASLHNILMELRKLDPLYEFSLAATMAQFAESVTSSSSSPLTSERILAINSEYTLNFYKSTSKALFERHRLLFSFLLCVKIMETEGKEVPKSYIDFLSSQLIIKTKQFVKLTAENTCSDWLPDSIWSNIVALKQLDAKFGIFQDSLLTENNDWREWFTNPQPECLPLIGELDSYEGMQRILLIVSLRPDRLTSCITNFIITQLGPEYLAHSELDLAQVLEKPAKPVLLLPGDGVDLQGGLETLALTTGHTLRVISLNVQAQSSLDNAAASDEWIYVMDCNHSIPYLSEIERNFTKLTSTHKNFRLWLSTQSDIKFPIYVTQISDKLTIERPKSLRWLMQRLLPLATETHEIYQQVAWQLTLLHSIIIERTRFKSLGWNQDYKFCDNDFTICCKLWSIVQNTCENDGSKTQLVVDLAYTGHFTSPWDQRLLSLLADHVFTEQPFVNSSVIIRSENSNTTSIDERQEVSTLDNLPMILHPESYGLHNNTALPVFEAESVQMQNYLRVVNSLPPPPPHTGSSNKLDPQDTEKVLQDCDQILDSVSLLYPTINNENFDIKKQMKITLLNEVFYYTSLITKIKRDCKELKNALLGKLPWSEKFNSEFKCLNANVVPSQWSLRYESDLKAWNCQLVMCVEELNQWKPQAAINLAILSSPFTFLSALLQMKSTHFIELDNMTWSFTIAKQNENLEDLTDTEGCIIKGVKLEGATWHEEGYLTENKPLILTSIMPYIHLKPTHVPDNTYFEEMYHCPCYLTKERKTHLFTVPLNPGLSTAEHWVLRSVALIISFD